MKHIDLPQDALQHRVFGDLLLRFDGSVFGDLTMVFVFDQLLEYKNQLLKT